MISNVYKNALLETMLNQHGFMCVFLKIKFANVRPEEMHCNKGAFKNAAISKLESNLIVQSEFQFGFV